jgi:hypothetical protein
MKATGRSKEPIASVSARKMLRDEPQGDLSDA